MTSFGTWQGERRDNSAKTCQGTAAGRAGCCSAFESVRINGDSPGVPERKDHPPGTAWRPKNSARRPCCWRGSADGKEPVTLSRALNGAPRPVQMVIVRLGWWQDARCRLGSLNSSRESLAKHSAPAWHHWYGQDIAGRSGGSGRCRGCAHITALPGIKGSGVELEPFAAVGHRL